MTGHFQVCCLFCVSSHMLTTCLVHKRKGTHTNRRLEVSCSFLVQSEQVNFFLWDPSPELQEKNIVPECFLATAP